MRYLLVFSIPLLLFGCRFAEFASTPGPDGRVPIVDAAHETLSGGLSALEEGGIVAGVVALVLTAGKTMLRVYRDYKQVEAMRRSVESLAPRSNP